MAERRRGKSKETIRKKIVCAAILLIFASAAFTAEGLVFPPELQWWTNEIKKAFPDFETDNAHFQKESENTEKIIFVDMHVNYPVFNKWNYSGYWYSNYPADASLIREKDGRWSLVGEPDSMLAIMNRRGQSLYRQYFGAVRLHGTAWLRDNLLISVGQEFDAQSEAARFVIYYYQIKSDAAVVTKYITINTYSWTRASGLKLRWLEQRDDLFNVEK